MKSTASEPGLTSPTHLLKMLINVRNVETFLSLRPSWQKERTGEGIGINRTGSQFPQQFASLVALFLRLRELIENSCGNLNPFRFYVFHTYIFNNPSSRKTIQDIKKRSKRGKKVNRLHYYITYNNQIN